MDRTVTNDFVALATVEPTYGTFSLRLLLLIALMTTISALGFYQNGA